MKKIILFIMLQLSLVMAGSFIMTKGNPLIKVDNTSTTTNNISSVPLIQSGAINVSLSSGETYIIEDKYFKDISGKAVNIIGTRDTDQTVIIRRSKFKNINWAINIYHVDNVLIEGNYFETVGAAIKVYKPKDLVIQYNKAKDYGVMLPDSGNWAGNFIQVGFASAVTNLVIEHNLGDRSGDTRANTHENTFVEDHISLHKVQMASGYESSIRYNYIIGAESNCESIGGGGITIDQLGERHLIADNVIYNAGAFAIGIASSRNSTVKDNLSYYSILHDNTLRNNQNNDDKIGPNWNNGLILTNWISPGEPAYDTENITVTGNRLTARRADDPTRHYQWLDVDRSKLTFSNNSFTNTLSGGTSTDGLPHMTQQEMDDLVFGTDRAGLFATHGQDTKYFDENRQ